MAFRDNNVAMGLPKNAPFQVGLSNLDSNEAIEQGVGLEWPSEAGGSYLYYDCTIGAMLDSGIVVHNRLPQVNSLADSLSVAGLDDVTLMQLKDRGTNFHCNDQYQDIVQRMGHARYWFRIWGQALRAGYQVPIPGIKQICGVAAIPYDKNPQWAFNRIFPGGNFGGVILWHAEWSLWYTTDRPPATQKVPAASPLAGTDATVSAAPPEFLQAPFSEADANAQKAAPTTGIVGISDGLNKRRRP